MITPPGRTTSDAALDLRLTVSPSRLIAGLAGVAAALVVGGVLVEVVRVGFGHRRAYGLVALLDLDGEANLPATYSAGLLAICAGTLWLLAQWRRQNGLAHSLALRLLSVALLALALDEAARVHELFSQPVREALGLGGALYFSWVIVYGALFLALVVALIPLASGMSPRIRLRVAVAAALYVGGAIGVELAGAAITDSAGRDNATYATLTTIEESMEIAGVLLLLHVLLTALRSASGTIHTNLASP